MPLPSSNNSTSQPVVEAVAVDKSSRSVVASDDKSTVQITTVNCSKNNYNCSTSKMTSNKPVESVVKCTLVAVDCNKRRVDEEAENGELMEFDEEPSKNITHSRET